MGTAPAKGVVGYAVSLIEEKRPFQPSLLAHSRHEKCSFLRFGRVYGDRGKICMFSVSFSGKICPVSPFEKVRGIADRVRHPPCLLYGFGIISGRFLTVTSRLFIRVQTSTAYGGMATDFGFSPLFACLCVLVALVREENPPCTQRGCHCSKYQPQSCAGSVADSVQNP